MRLTANISILVTSYIFNVFIFTFIIAVNDNKIVHPKHVEVLKNYRNFHIANAYQYDEEISLNGGK